MNDSFCPSAVAIDRLNAVADDFIYPDVLQEADQFLRLDEVVRDVHSHWNA